MDRHGDVLHLGQSLTIISITPARSRFTHLYQSRPFLRLLRNGIDDNSEVEHSSTLVSDGEGAVEWISFPRQAVSYQRTVIRRRVSRRIDS
jgi:hypothetical protein